MHRRPIFPVAVGVAALLLAAVSMAVLLLLGVRPFRGGWLTDGQRVRVPVADADPRRILWEPAEPLPGSLASELDQYEPRIAPDGTTMVFVRGRPGGGADLVECRRTPSGWSEPEPVTALNSVDDELAPEWASDGAALLFSSNRPGGLGGYDLWIAHRSDSGFSEPAPLGAVINGPFDEYGPALDPLSGALCFVSDRPRPGAPAIADRGWSATVREQRSRGDFDLFVALPTAEGFAPAERMTALSTTADEAAPAIGPHGDLLYFASDRDGGSGGFDLYRARLAIGAERFGPTGFGSVEWLGCEVNSPANELDPTVAAEGFRIAFASDRGGGPYRLWSSVSREVYEVAAPRSAVLGDLFRWLLPWLLALLLAAATVLAAWWLWRDLVGRGRWRTLNLLAKCLLLSLLVHALLAALFTVWRVGTELGAYLRGDRGATQVFLVAADAAGDGSVAAQVFAAASDAPMPTPLIEAVPTLSDATGPQPAIVSPVELPPSDVPMARPSAPPAERPTPEPPTMAAAPAAPPALDLSAAALPAANAPRTSAAAEPTVGLAPVVAAVAAVPVVGAGEPSRVADVPLPDPAASEWSPLPIDASTPRPAAGSDRAASPSLSASASPGAAAPSVADARLPEIEIAANPAVERSLAADTAPVLSGTLPAPSWAPRSATAVARPSPEDSWLAAAPAMTIAPIRPIEDDARPQQPRGASAEPASAARATAALSAEGAALPSDAPLPEPIETFAQRDRDRRAELLAESGGSTETERAVALALAWFARHQNDDGSWGGQAFAAHCSGERCDGTGEADAPAAMTGLALLALLGAGHTHVDDGPYRDCVDRALRWLIARQDPSGDFRGGDETMYGQTIACVALCEAYAMTKDAALADPARRAIAFVLDGRRADRSTAAGTAVIGWQIMAIESARRAGIAVPTDTFAAASRWLDSVADRRGGGRYAHRPGEAPSAAMTAEAMFVRQLLGADASERRMQESAAFLLETPPSWRDGASTYFWYYATLALFQHQGPAWRRWNEALVAELLAHQRTDGCAAGSWDPQDRWSRLGGRHYQTAICALSLEVYYRYARTP